MAKLITEMPYRGLSDAEIYQKLHKMGYHGTAGKYSHSELGHEIDINHPHGMKMTYHDPVGRKQEKFFKNKVDLLKHIDSLKPSIVGPSGKRG